MRYRSQFHGRRRSSGFSGTVVVIGLAFIVIAGLFAYGIWWFRFRDKTVPEPTAASTIENVLSPTSVSMADLASTTSGASHDAILRDVSGGSGSGTGFRDTVDGQFVVRLKLSLPEIDRERDAYEGWLVRQLPYGYFSIGEVVTNDDGEWVLEWTGAPGEFDGYTRVVVTREAKDGNPDPSGHVLGGEFK